MARRKVNSSRLTEYVAAWINFNAAYRLFGLALLIIGLSFYVAWSILYNTWTDPGLYSVVVIFVVFGFLSILLGTEKAKVQNAS